MTKGASVPYVAAEILNGRLVRICPECRQTIPERTDDEGIVSNNFVEHWEEEHRDQPPERQRLYLLGLQPRLDGEGPGLGPEVRRNLGQLILGIVKRQMPEVDWELVERFEDLPDDAPTLIASQVLRGSWQRDGDDPQLQHVRWHRREADRLVFTPTATQLEGWDAATKRARDVRAALIERHRDRLPKFTGKTVAGWNKYYEKKLKPQQDAIARDFDAAQQDATKQFYSGDYRWQATLEAAIVVLGIPTEEVDDLREQTEARLREAEEQLGEALSR